MRRITHHPPHRQFVTCFRIRQRLRFRLPAQQHRILRQTRVAVPEPGDQRQILRPAFLLLGQRLHALDAELADEGFRIGIGRVQ